MLSTIHVVAPVLGVLLSQGHVAVVETIADAFDAGDHGDDSILSVHQIACLFAITTLNDRFLDVLDSIADRWRFAIAPALRTCFRGWPPQAELWMAEEAAGYLLSFATDDRAGYVFANNKHNTGLYIDEYAIEAFTNPLAIRLNHHYFTGPSAADHTGTHVRVWVALDALSSSWQRSRRPSCRCLRPRGCPCSSVGPRVCERRSFTSSRASKTTLRTAVMCL